MRSMAIGWLKGGKSEKPARMGDRGSDTKLPKTVTKAQYDKRQ
jgi:hypothetical protein